MVQKLNSENFTNEVLNKSGLVLVDFYADWCGPCKMLAPILEDVSEEREDIVIAKINVDESADVASEYAVLNIPTMIIFKDGKAIARTVGFKSKENILEIFDKFDVN